MENLKVLVLNSAFEPLQFTAVKRAFVLVMLGKAEAIESDGFFARTVTQTFRLPTVIKLNRYVRRPYMHGVAFSRKNVLRRDGHSCQYCGYSGNDLTVDHVVPKASGGKSDWENVATACKKCNIKKGSKLLKDTNMILKQKPVKPKFIVFTRMPENHPKSHKESWGKYL